MALGMDDPMDLSPDQIDQVKEYLLDHRDQFRDFAESDASMVNLFKSGEVVIADGGRGTTETMIKDGVPVAVDRAQGGRALVGLRARDHLQGARTSTPPTSCINYYASARGAGDLRRERLRGMNPKALPLIAPEYRKTADPRQPGHGDPRDPAADRRALRPGLAGGRRRMSATPHVSQPVALGRRGRAGAQPARVWIRIRRRLPGSRACS